MWEAETQLLKLYRASESSSSNPESLSSRSPGNERRHIPDEVASMIAQRTMRPVEVSIKCRVLHNGNGYHQLDLKVSAPDAEESVDTAEIKTRILNGVNQPHLPQPTHIYVVMELFDAIREYVANDLSGTPVENTSWPDLQPAWNQPRPLVAFFESKISVDVPLDPEEISDVENALAQLNLRGSSSTNNESTKPSNPIIHQQSNK